MKVESWRRKRIEKLARALEFRTAKWKGPKVLGGCMDVFFIGLFSQSTLGAMLLRLSDPR